MVVEPRRLLRSAQSVRSMLGYTSACRHLATRSNSIWITKKELSSLLNSSDILIIDVREPNEILETGIIPGAFNVPCTESLSSNSTLFRERFGFNREDLISKRSGVQSARSVEIAKELGFHKLVSMWLVASCGAALLFVDTRRMQMLRGPPSAHLLGLLCDWCLSVFGDKSKIRESLNSLNPLSRAYGKGSLEVNIPVSERRLSVSTMRTNAHGFTKVEVDIPPHNQLLVFVMFHLWNAVGNTAIQESDVTVSISSASVRLHLHSITHVRCIHLHGCRLVMEEIYQLTWPQGYLNLHQKTVSECCLQGIIPKQSINETSCKSTAGEMRDWAFVL
ncbi:unnamed protein product [Mesocestoides corti]|uniref:Rhodanese domain-containing protein n=1 Tax=Mesocestoides corti TaxID=53468 RepID=A0A0R3U3D9_MESCO|nr:unnamed protein product [Mesocestoides corti]